MPLTNRKAHYLICLYDTQVFEIHLSRPSHLHEWVADSPKNSPEHGGRSGKPGYGTQAKSHSLSKGQSASQDFAYLHSTFIDMSSR